MRLDRVRFPAARRLQFVSQENRSRCASCGTPLLQLGTKSPDKSSGRQAFGSSARFSWDTNFHHEKKGESNGKRVGETIQSARYQESINTNGRAWCIMPHNNVLPKRGVAESKGFSWSIPSTSSGDNYYSPNSNGTILDNKNFIAQNTA